MKTDGDEVTTYQGGLVSFPEEAKVGKTVVKAPPSAFELLMGTPELGVGLAKATVIEFVGTTIFSFMHIGIVRLAIRLVPWTDGIVASTHALMLALFIYTCGAPSGGHLNPTISMATAMTGHTSVIRALFYIIAQVTGATLGASLMKIAIGGYRADAELGPGALAECTLGSLTTSEALVAEVMYSLFLLFIAYGVAFDPRQGALFGPLGAPIVIGLTLGLVIFGSGAISATPGAIVASANFALCVGSNYTSVGLFGHEWVYVLGTFLAGLVEAIIYICCPPHHASGFKFSPPLLATEKL